MNSTHNYVEVLQSEIASDKELAELVLEENFYADIARQIYEARMNSCKTQKELAELVGTKQSVISRIEDADYHGHSNSLLLKIAFALGLRLRIEMYKPDSFHQTLDMSGVCNWDADCWGDDEVSYAEADSGTVSTDDTVKALEVS